jgi:hypothetical protein
VTRIAFALALICLALGWAKPSRADAASWLYVGGGAGVLDRQGSENHSILQVDTGLGTEPSRSLVLGGLFRGQGLFGQGLDLAVLTRLAMGSFVRGGFGAGLDAGVYQRWWGQNSTGFTGGLVLGAPWGLTLSGGASIGSNDQKLFYVTLGIDFARLTVHRQSGLDWFPNPMRSPRPAQPSSVAMWER